MLLPFWWSGGPIVHEHVWQALASRAACHGACAASQAARRERSEKTAAQCSVPGIPSRGSGTAAASALHAAGAAAAITDRRAAGLYDTQARHFRPARSVEGLARLAALRVSLDMPGARLNLAELHYRAALRIDPDSNRRAPTWRGCSARPAATPTPSACWPRARNASPASANCSTRWAC
jgi:hypothetical protein